MSNDLNRLMIIGRIVRDADIRQSQNGNTIANLSVACNRKAKIKGEWEEKVSFFEVTIFGRLAEAIQGYLTKGKQIGVVGELTQDRWEKDGQTRSKVKIIADSVQLLGSKGETSGDNGGQSNAAPVDDFQDDVPF